MSDVMRSLVHNCVVNLRVGIHEHEKASPQRVIVNVELEADLTHRFQDLKDDDLSKIIDYSKIRQFVCHDLPRQNHIPLLETVAEQILAFCFTDPLVQKARIRLEKPHIFPETESVGVELVRERPSATPAGKTVLITGAAKRIGRVIALELAKTGWDIVAHYNTAHAETESLADEIRALGRNVHLVQADLSDPQAVENLIPSIPTLTALVNNASLFERDEQDADGSRHKQINVAAPCHLIEAFYKTLSQNSQGTVVNLLDSNSPQPHFDAYISSKNAIRGATLAYARQFAPRLRLNAVALGMVLINPRESQEHFNRMVAATPLQTPIAPSAVAQAVRLLLESTAITGQILYVDGGIHLETENR